MLASLHISPIFGQLKNFTKFMIYEFIAEAIAAQTLARHLPNVVVR